MNIPTTTSATISISATTTHFNELEKEKARKFSAKNKKQYHEPRATHD